MSRALIFLVICALPCRKIEWGSRSRTQKHPLLLPSAHKKLSGSSFRSRSIAARGLVASPGKKMFVGKGNVRWVFIASLLRQSCVHKVDEISFVFPQDR